MKLLRRYLFSILLYENGGATKNLQNLITFLTNRNIDIELISGNANYSNFKFKKKKLKIVKPKKD